MPARRLCFLYSSSCTLCIILLCSWSGWTRTRNASNVYLQYRLLCVIIIHRDGLSSTHSDHRSYSHSATYIGRLSTSLPSLPSRSYENRSFCGVPMIRGYSEFLCVQREGQNGGLQMARFDRFRLLVCVRHLH
jgi:hypothetical protein